MESSSTQIQIEIFPRLFREWEREAEVERVRSCFVDTLQEFIEDGNYKPDRFTSNWNDIHDADNDKFLINRLAETGTAAGCVVHDHCRNCPGTPTSNSVTLLFDHAIRFASPDDAFNSLRERADSAEHIPNIIHFQLVFDGAVYEKNEIGELVVIE